ncbi:RNA-binding protein 5-like isoform X2 [Schistocerca gregaria]|uniref:RNA-binding protein 5-like isoform X2 n=1 Tax=Schistocerca gregaria TaxID=7010 RepID=UPI00211E942F|nr:RNA-binding protein 5-like isoform X2 [Schistocerca gregaria]XP_049847954.1 RNA-binding protein 5-like isoform X2 [Schistocerca gregaria]
MLPDTLLKTMGDCHDDKNNSDARLRLNDSFDNRSSDAYHSHRHSRGNSSTCHSYRHSNRGGSFSAHHNESHFSHYECRDGDRHAEDRVRFPEEGFSRSDRDRYIETRERYSNRKPRDRYCEERDRYGNRDDYFDHDSFNGKGGGDNKNNDRHHDYHYRNIRKKPTVYDDLDFPSSILCLSNVSAETNEDKICDLLKVFGPVEEVKRVFENGKLQDKVVVHFSSLSQASSMYSLLTSANPPFEICGQIPKISYCHPSSSDHHSEPKRERPAYRNVWICLNCNADNYSNRDSCFSCGVPKKNNVKFSFNSDRLPYNAAKNTDKWKEFPAGHKEYFSPAAKSPQTETKILVRGLPRDYADGEMQKVIHSTLSIPHNVKIFSSVHVSREHVSNACSGYAILNFLDNQLAEDLMNKTSGKIYLNGDTLTLVLLNDANKSSTGSSDFNKQSPDNTLGQGMTIGQPLEGQNLNINHTTYAPSEKWNNVVPFSPTGSNFVYDKDFGYLLETKSGLYFEPNSGLFFNPSLGLYFYFDPSSDSFKPWIGFSQPVPVTSSEEAEADATKSAPPTDATSQSASSVATSETIPAEASPEDKPSATLDQVSSESSKTLSAPVSFNLKVMLSSKPIFSTPKVAAIFSKNRDPLITSKSSRPPSPPRRYFPSTASRSSAVAPPQQAPPPATASPVQQQPIHTKGTICLICKRQLNSMELLERHIKESELHKKNLAALQPSNLEPVSAKAESETYQHNTSKRSRESINSYTQKSKANVSDAYSDANDEEHIQLEEPHLLRTTPLLPEEPKENFSIGLRMMQKMGYTGGGLGKRESGTVNPMQVLRRSDRAGLPNGEQIERQISKVESYAQAAKRTFQARWEEIQREKRNK